MNKRGDLIPEVEEKRGDLICTEKKIGNLVAIKGKGPNKMTSQCAMMTSEISELTSNVENMTAKIENILSKKSEVRDFVSENETASLKTSELTSKSENITSKFDRQMIKFKDVQLQQSIRPKLEEVSSKIKKLTSITEIQSSKILKKVTNLQNIPIQSKNFESKLDNVSSRIEEFSSKSEKYLSSFVKQTTIVQEVKSENKNATLKIEKMTSKLAELTASIERVSLEIKKENLKIDKNKSKDFVYAAIVNFCFIALGLSVKGKFNYSLLVLLISNLLNFINIWRELPLIISPDVFLTFIVFIVYCVLG